MKMKVEKERRYALLQAARDTEYVNKIYGGYFNVFVAAFGAEEGETWDLFRVVEGEFPDMNDLQFYDGFVVSGSPYDAYANDSWIVKLCFLLQTLDAMEKKILGICFGHQVLCRALGGKVGKAYTGWDIGVRKVKMVKESAARLLDVDDDELELESIPGGLSIIECHQDEVWEVPPGAEVVAYSEKTGVEMFTIGGHVLGIQGHPEYSKDILCSLIDRLFNNNCIDKEFSENTKLALQITQPDTNCWEKICKTFLKGKQNSRFA